MILLVTLLSIETSTDSCSLAIANNNTVLKEYICPSHANHAGQLTIFLEKCFAWMNDNNFHPEAVALSKGPGSYTGLRIGASVAKGICYGLDIPLIAVDTLRVIAWKAASALHSDTNVVVCPMIDARRMEVYTAFYTGDKAIRQTPVEAIVVNKGSFNETLEEQVVCFAGNGAAKCKEVLESPNARFMDDIIPTAGTVAEIALYMLHQEKAEILHAKELAYFEPFYLKEFMPAPSHIKGLEKK